ncbi:MAG: oxalurate catabolism protein HpxZ [Devosia sp.]
MVVDDPETLAQMRAVFEAYERAFVANDIDALDGFFHHAPTTIRYGVADLQRGMDELRAYRHSVSAIGLERDLRDTVITTYGTDLAVASTLFFRDRHPGKTGRQMQTWIRTPDGWRIVAAHVSVIANPA